MTAMSSTLPYPAVAVIWGLSPVTGSSIEIGFDGSWLDCINRYWAL
jgi:hypothetical protein